MPDLSEDEFAELKADICERGVLVPVEYDELGNILDGHHRVRACQELGIADWPRLVRAGMTDDEKAEHALTLNLARRHLSREQRQELVATLRQRGWSLRRIATRLGVTHPTVLEDLSDPGGRSLPPPTVTGSDGKRYPATRPTTAFAATAEEQAAVLPFLAEVPSGAVVAASDVTRTPAQVLREAREIKSKRREERRQERDEAREQAMAEAVQLPDRLRLIHADFRLCMEVADGTVDLVFTDPPYGEDALQLWHDLAEWTARKLRDGGLLLTYSGQVFLPAVVDALREHLEYRWTAGVYHTGGHQQVWRDRVWCQWKPVLLFSKGTPREHDWFLDMYHGEKGEKDLHEWSQGEAEARYFIERLTEPGMLVVDPMCGSGTIARAANDLTRLALGIELDDARYQAAVARVSKGEHAA